LTTTFSVTNRSTGEVGKMIGEKWKELTDKDKEQYDAKAKIDKERYEREKAEYAAVSATPFLSAQTLTDRNCSRALTTKRDPIRFLS
jgi:hypothetical protein